MDVVIFDTNLIDNLGGRNFFGQIKLCKKVAKTAKIYIPNMVIEEIKKHKLSKLQEELDIYESNYFRKEFGENVPENYINDRIDELYENSGDEFEHEKKGLEEGFQYMNFLQHLALNSEPPFVTLDQGEGKTDRGFKDICIYLTAIQIAERNSNADIFFFSNDGRLQEAFEKNKDIRIEPIKKFEDYFNFCKVRSEKEDAKQQYLKVQYAEEKDIEVQRIEEQHIEEKYIGIQYIEEPYFEEDYFIENLIKVFGDESITKDDISEIRRDSNNNWEMIVSVATGFGPRSNFRVIIDYDTREIIYTDLIYDLEEEKFIRDLEEYQREYSDDWEEENE